MKSSLSLILTWHSSIIFSVDLFDVTGLPIQISQTHLWQTNCYERDAICMALMSLRGLLKSPPITIWTTQCILFTALFAFIEEMLKFLRRINKTWKKIKCTTAMLRWETGLTHIDSNMWNTLKVLAHILLSRMPCNGIWSPSAGHVSVSQVRGDVTTTASIFIFTQKEQLAEGPLQRCLNAETQDDEKLYEITLFSECAVIPFLQESYRLKYLSKMACSEANRWSFETHRRHKTIFFLSTALPTLHTISMHTFCQQIGRERRRKKGEKIFAVQKNAPN